MSKILRNIDTMLNENLNIIQNEKLNVTRGFREENQRTITWSDKRIRSIE